MEMYTHVVGLVAKSCPTLCDPRDCSPQGSSVRGILHKKILEWVAIAFSRESSRPRDQSWVSYIAGRFFTELPGKDTHICENTKKEKKKKGSSSYWQYTNQRTVIISGVGWGGAAAGQHMDNFQGIVMVQFSLRLGTGFISAHHWILKFHMILYSIHNIVY